MERIGAVLGDLAGKDTIPQRLAQARALAAWPEVVGAHLAERTRALRVNGRRLVVLAPGGALRQELSFHRGKILARFNRIAGAVLAREILFLESDSLDHEPVPPSRSGPSIGAADGAGEAEDDAQGVDGGWTDVGAMYERFDAEAYRNGLARIAGARKEAERWETR